MDRATFEETMQAFQRQAPFRPFTIALMNGDRVEVDHPGALIVREGRGLFAGPGGVPHIFDYEGVTQIIGDLAGNKTA